MKTLKWLLAKFNLLLIVIWVVILSIIIFPILALGLVIDPNSLWRDNLADWFILKLKTIKLTTKLFKPELYYIKNQV